MPELVITPEDTVSRELDIEAMARAHTRAWVLKGMFFSRIVNMLGSQFAEVMPTLEAPPRFGRYVPFSDYPQADYLRLAVAVAQRTYGSWPLSEGIRRLSRDDFGVFANSTLGKVLLAVTGDVHTALLNVAAMYAKVASGGWTISGEAIDAGAVRVKFGPLIGPWEFQLGQLEGIVLSYGLKPTIRLLELRGNTMQFDVRHTPV